ncbi:hypothetical protein PSYPI_47296, partial [Pseudomonas syringae pv. pisi str. 1704B]
GFTNDPLLQGRLFSYTDTQIMVPKGYLEHPASSLPQVIHIS